MDDGMALEPKREEAPKKKPKSSVFMVKIKDKDELYQHYMPFVKGGGLFIRTDKKYRLGDEIVLLLQLMDEPDKHPIGGRVIWITPKGAQGSRDAGIGVQFMHKEAPKLRARIETYLAGALKSERHTDTM